MKFQNRPITSNNFLTRIPSFQTCNLFTSQSVFKSYDYKVASDDTIVSFKNKRKISWLSTRYLFNHSTPDDIRVLTYLERSIQFYGHIPHCPQPLATQTAGSVKDTPSWPSPLSSAFTLLLYWSITLLMFVCGNPSLLKRETFTKSCSSE